MAPLRFPCTPGTSLARWIGHYHFARSGPARASPTGLGTLYGDPLEIWRSWADELQGHEVESGHHMAEEIPEVVAAALRDFLVT